MNIFFKNRWRSHFPFPGGSPDPGLPVFHHISNCSYDISVLIEFLYASVHLMYLFPSLRMIFLNPLSHEMVLDLASLPCFHAL